MSKPITSEIVVLNKKNSIWLTMKEILEIMLNYIIMYILIDLLFLIILHGEIQPKSKFLKQMKNLPSISLG